MGIVCWETVERRVILGWLVFFIVCLIILGFDLVSVLSFVFCGEGIGFVLREMW